MTDSKYLGAYICNTEMVQVVYPSTTEKEISDRVDSAHTGYRGANMCIDFDNIYYLCYAANHMLKLSEPYTLYLPKNEIMVLKEKINSTKHYFHNYPTIVFRVNEDITVIDRTKDAVASPLYGSNGHVLFIYKKALHNILYIIDEEFDMVGALDKALEG